MKIPMEASKKIQKLERILRDLPNLPDTFTYTNLYQNIQSLYVMEKYSLVCELCNAIISELED